MTPNQNTIAGRVAFLWTLGPAHQTWFVLAGVFALTGLVLIITGNYSQAAQSLLTTIGMFVIPL